MLKGKTVSATELTDIVFAEQEYENPVKAVNNLIYRLRKMIDGNEATGYIRRTGDGYSWNMTAAFTLDIMNFERFADDGAYAPYCRESRTRRLLQQASMFIRMIFYARWCMSIGRCLRAKTIKINFYAVWMS